VRAGREQDVPLRSRRGRPEHGRGDARHRHAPASRARRPRALTRGSSEAAAALPLTRRAKAPGALGQRRRRLHVAERVGPDAGRAGKGVLRGQLLGPDQDTRARALEGAGAALNGAELRAAIDAHLDREYLVRTLSRLATVPTDVPMGYETYMEPDDPKLVHYV